jgi:hypothetical protein
LSSALLRLILRVALLMDKRAADQPAGAAAWQLAVLSPRHAAHQPRAASGRQGRHHPVGARAELSDGRRGPVQRGRLDASRGGERRYALSMTMRQALSERPAQQAGMASERRTSMIR